jgi:hypothetical protein
VTEARLVLNSDDDTVSKKQADCFRFAGYEYDTSSGLATLSYEVDGSLLQEKIVFPWAPWPVDASRQFAFFQALELLHLIAGISYYKAGLARRIDPGDNRIDTVMADFLNDLYFRGLGEFAYVNHLDISGLAGFESGFIEPGVYPDTTRAGHPKPRDLDLPERALVAIGGGKDSLVGLKLLRDAGIEVQPACVGGSALIGETVKQAGLPLIRIQRELSNQLTVLNANGAWNGHVPVTAINSAILLCAGLLYGYRYIVFANESSANEATLTDNQGMEINHQFSKSLAFEQSFREVVQNRVSPGIEYFSLLRPFSEIAVTRLFSEMTEFHGVFSSCNRNFHQDGSHIDDRWCRACPKCRFVALALAAFIPPMELETIQGADLLDQEEQLDGFSALCGLGAHKPFECVGSVAESRAAMKYLATKAVWRDKFVVKAMAEIPEIASAGELDLKPDLVSGHCIPNSILTKLDAF